MTQTLTIDYSALGSDSTASDHFVVATDGPARFEVSLLPLPQGGFGIIMHGYHGKDTDPEQEPDVVYDGSIRDEVRTQVVVIA